MASKTRTINYRPPRDVYETPLVQMFYRLSLERQPPLIQYNSSRQYIAAAHRGWNDFKAAIKIPSVSWIKRRVNRKLLIARDAA